MNAMDKMIKARGGLVLDFPFFGSLALRLTLHEDETCKTAYTDGKALGFNPERVGAWSLAECKGVIAHAVMHCASSHHTRREGRDKTRWNKAADYAINSILENSKVTLPASRLLDVKYNGMSAEAIYTLLPQEDEQNSEQDPGGTGEVRDSADENGHTESPAEMEKTAAQWKISTAQAMQQAKAMGDMPDGLERFVKEIIRAKVDWRETLRRFIQTTAKNDYSWSPPNRRHIHEGLYLPSLRSEELRPIVGGIDTSGSRNEQALQQVASEVNSILEEYNTTFHAVYCDKKIQGVEEFSRDNLPVIFNAKGGGGTDFRPVFEWVESEGIDPSCMIFCTDMEGRFPESEPGYPVLWINFGDNDIEAPFGETVHV